MPRQTVSDAIENVVYSDKDNHQEFFVIANEGMTEKWRKDKSIPLVDVVQSFSVYEHDANSHQGIVHSPSKQLLLQSFNSNNEMDVVQAILEKGKVQPNTSHRTVTGKHDGRSIESRGKGASNVQPGVHG
ncbi:hypothetical protein RI367_008186 [Sorochytrium milnesiophthora]